MSYPLPEAPVKEFDDTWQPPWTGTDRVFVVADIVGSPSQYLAYGTDGTDSFRVRGYKSGLSESLTKFYSLMDSEGGRELAVVVPDHVILTPPDYPASMLDPTTDPSLELVQYNFDQEYGLKIAA